MGILFLVTAGAGAGAESKDPAPIDWAKAREHWSFQPPRKPAIPSVKDSAWPRQRLDRFVLAKLESANLTPSPEADSRTLARRLYWDITGLPPSPGDVQAFLQDKASDSYERLVDRLLADDAFGERMASLWLNLSRYAEDQAHIVGSDTSLFYPNAYKYREWIIGAFNADLPYDSFIRKQLAADLIEPGNEADLAALGFLGLGHKLYSRGRADVQAEEWAEQVDTISQTFLGLTVACARCHDHKFDPITMRDYYALAGVFASVQMVNRTPDGAEEKPKTLADKMNPATLHIVKEGEPRDLPIYERGDVESPGAPAPRGFLQVLSPGEPVRFQKGSGRAELADAIAAATNPLTARVMVNRVWDLFFGKPLARTPSNFGHMGDAPTHPELLDDLSLRFIENGWSLKQLIREMVLSATYRQSSQGSAANAQLDQANQFYWRMERRRLTIEQFRDAVLSVAGTLNRAGGKSVEIDAPSNDRRTVYARVSRHELNKTLMLFDYPDANVHAARRSNSSTPTQKLFILNSPFMLAQSKALAKNLQQSGATDDVARIRSAYQRLFSREPGPEELEFARAFLDQAAASGGMSNWEQLAQALLATNEMMYVD